MFRVTRRQFAYNDEGSALIAVIGVMAVAVIVSLAVANVTLSSLGYTSATRSAVQAQAAAEAGIDSTEAELAKTACVASYASTTAPKFTVKISYSAQDIGDSWTDGCAVPSAKRVKLVSTGTAPTIAGTGNSTGGTRVVEAIYLMPVPESSLAATGPAVYAYSATGFNGSGKLASVDGSIPSVLLRKDNATCDGASIVGGDLVTAEGNITISGSCKIAGSAWAGGTLTTSGSVSVGGNATSRSTGADSMSLTGVTVTGTAWAAGPMKMSQSTVNGNITAPALDLVGGTVKGNAWAAGAAIIGEGTGIGGTLTAKSANKLNSAAGGTTIKSAGPGPGPAAGPTPVVPNWVDFNYNFADWKGFQQRVISGTCDWSQISEAAALLAGGPGIIDARTCTNALSISDWQKLPLANDLAIIAKSFNLGGSSGFTATSARKLWLIVPDAVADGKPTCPAGGYFTVGGAFTIPSNVRAMIYSPCLVSITSGIDWYGQVFSGQAVINGAATLNYAPLGLPGVNLSEGTVTVPSGAGALGARISILDRGSNG